MKKYLEKYNSILTYGVFGVLTTLINVAVYHICYRFLGVGNVPSTVLAWVIAVAFAFVTNKIFVFKSPSWKRDVLLQEGIKFLGCRVGTGLLEVAIMYLTVDLAGLDGTAMKLAVNILVIILNYIFSRWLIFKKK